MEKAASSWITTCLESWGAMRDVMTEAFFLNAYGSRLLQAQVGLAAAEDTPRRIERDLVREAAAAERRANLDRKFEEGGLEEAALRALIYVRLPDGAFDERSFRMLKAIREQRKSNARITPSQLRDMLNVQLQLVRLDEERAIEAVPKLLRGDEDDVAAAWSAMRQLVAAPGRAGFGGSAPLGSGREAVRQGSQTKPKPKGRQCLMHQLGRPSSRTTNMIV